MPNFLSGSIWSSFNAGTSVVLPLLIFVLFARIMPVAEVGVVALAVACSELGKTVALPGLYEAVLFQKADTARMEETALAVMVPAGAALSLLFGGLIFLMGHFVDGVAAHEVPLSLVGLRILFDSLTQQPQANLARRLQYRRMATRSVVANAAAGAVGVGLALWGDPLWGLVLYQVLQAGITMLMTVVGTKALAVPRFHRDCWQKLRQEALWATAVRMVAGANNYLDQIMVANLIGSVLLGYFNLAKRVEVTFITLSSSFNGILFQPLFASARDGERRGAMENSLAVIVLVCGLPAAMVLVNSHAIIGLAFGERWDPAAVIAGVLALSGFVRALGSVHGAVLSISGRNRQVMAVSSAAVVGSVVAMVAGAPFGLLACSLALLAKNVASSLWQAGLTRFDLPQVVAVYAWQVCAPFALMVACALAGASLAWSGGPGDNVGNLVQVAVSGCAATAAAAAYFGWRFFPELLAFKRGQGVSLTRPTPPTALP